MPPTAPPAARPGVQGAEPPGLTQRNLSLRPSGQRSAAAMARSPSTASERHVLQQQIQVLDGPAGVLPRPLLYLVLPVGVDPPTLDTPTAPPLLILERRRRQRLAQQLL